MADVYISCSDRAALEAFATNFVNRIGPVQGRAATETDAGAGDPSLFYTCIRATVDIAPLVTSPLAVVDPVIGAAVCGVWA